MKKIILMFVCAAFTLVGYAQTAEKKAAAPATKVEAKTEYVCPMCSACSEHVGKCEHCKVDLVKAGTYHCAKCHTTGEKEGKCSKCHAAMTKLECKKEEHKEEHKKAGEGSEHKE